MKTIIRLMISAAMLAGAAHSADPYPAFKSIYEANKELGAPHSQQTTLAAYQAWHDRAVVIWVKRAEAFYLLNINTFRWYKINDPHADDIPSGSDAFYDDVQLRGMFQPRDSSRRPERWKVPDNGYPPWAGVAHLWLDNGRDKIQSMIDAMGWRVAHCGLEPAQVFFQEFDNGVMIGPVRANTKDDHMGVIYTLVNDQPWKTSIVMSAGADSVKVPACVVPWTSAGGKTTVN